MPTLPRALHPQGGGVGGHDGGADSGGGGKPPRRRNRGGRGGRSGSGPGGDSSNGAGFRPPDPSNRLHARTSSPGCTRTTVQARALVPHCLSGFTLD